MNNNQPQVNDPQRKHVFHECNCWEYGCQYCDGGLAFCTVCHGMEGSLTTHCCGRVITDEEEKRIYIDANLNFRNGLWRQEKNYPRFAVDVEAFIAEGRRDE